MVPSRNEHLDKAGWRRQVAARRASVPAWRQAAEAGAIIAAASALVAGRTVCAYLPFGTEPGSPELPQALLAAGARVLLPIVPATPGPLDWAEFTGAADLRPGLLTGVREPGTERLGAAAIAGAGLVLVPALAVDERGIRLGRGAGFYDRTLPLAAPGAELIAVVRDTELVGSLPAEPHDVAMTGALLPGRGLVRLPLV